MEPTIEHAIKGLVTVTISGSQGSGKTLLTAIIKEQLELAGVSVIVHGPGVPSAERGRRKLYHRKPAKVSIVEEQCGIVEAEESELLFHLDKLHARVQKWGVMFPKEFKGSRLEAVWKDAGKALAKARGEAA